MDEQLNDNADDEEKTDEEICEQYLNFIQSTITRMAKNSFQAKAWCVTIIAALIAFYLTQSDETVHVVSGVFSIAIIALFFVFDVYYLYLERGYRYLYEVAARLREGEHVAKYDMRIPKSKRGFKNYVKAMRSMSTGVFYAVLAVIQIVLLLAYR